MITARSEPFGPGDFELAPDEDLPPVGPAIVEKWKKGRCYDGSWSEEDQARMFEYFLKSMMCKPTSVGLLDTGRFKGKVVTWIPGHIIGDRYSWGPMPADIMVVGKIPGEQEEKKERFWVGPAGKLLAKELGNRGVDVTQCYGTNVNKFTAPYPNMKSIPAAWVKEGSWFLRQEIRIVKPKFILLLGVDALKAVLGRGATLKRYRGLVSEFEGAQVMVTNNPADLLRNPERMDVFLQDLDRFVRLVRGESLTPSDTEYHYLRNQEQLEQAVEACMDSKTFAVDAEWNTATDHLLTVQFSRKAREAFVVVLRSDVHQTEFYPSQSCAVTLLRKLLCRPDVCIVGHNFRSDLRIIQHLGLDLIDQFAMNGFDTMLAHHLILENAEHNLTSCALTDTDMGRYDADMARYLAQGYTHGTVPEDVLLPYAAGDADATFRIYTKYHKILWDEHKELCKEKGVDPVKADYAPHDPKAQEHGWIKSCWNLFRYVVMPVNLAINEMEMTGVVGDPDRILEMAKIFAKKRDDIVAEIRAMIHEPAFNPRSTKQVARLFFGRPGSECKDGKVHTQLGYNPLKTTGKRPKMWDECVYDKEVYYLEEPVWEEKDGKEVMVKEAGWNSDFHSPCTDAETLAVLAEDYDCKEAEMMRNYRFIDQICKNFLVLPEDVQGDMKFTAGLGGAIRRDGRIHTTISQLTETGRYRSSDPNMQNLPKGREGDLAKLFRADEEVPPVRTCCLAAPGHVLVEADLESAELYTLAWLAHDEKMKADLELRDAEGKKISLHTTQAINIFKLDMTPQEFDTQRKRDGPEGKKLGGLRVAAKSVNFGGNMTAAGIVQAVAFWPNQNRGKNGNTQRWATRGEGESQLQRLEGEIIPPRGRDVRKDEKIVWTARITKMKVQKPGIKSLGDNKSIPYQRGAKAIARQVQREGVACSVQDAQGWIDAFYDNYKKVGRFIEDCKDSVYEPGWLSTVYGRVRHFHEGDEASMAAQQREACNFPIQSTVADATSQSLVLIEQERNRRNMKFRIVLQVHDAVILEVPYAEVPEAMDILRLCMGERVEVPGIGLHYGVDIAVFQRWNEKLEDPEILELCGLKEKAV